MGLPNNTRRIAKSQAWEHGVTIVELVVAMTVAVVLTGVVTQFALTYWGNDAALQASEQTLVSRMNAGDYLREIIDSANGMISQNDLPDSHTGSVDISDSTGTHWTAIHAIPGDINMGAAGTVTPVFYMDRPSVDTSKNIVMNGAIPYLDNVVVYLDGSTKQLMSRTIANSSAVGNRAATTCPPAIASIACPPDKIIAEDVAGVKMRYFSRSGNTIDYTSIVDGSTGQYIGPDFTSVEIVELTLKLSRKAELRNTKDTKNQTVIRVALRN